MGIGIPASASAQLVSDAIVSDASRLKMVGPIRLTVVCAVLLSVAIVIGASLFLFSLRNRILAENERKLSNTALILAKQSEKIFTKIESVQKAIIQQTADFGTIDAAGRKHQQSRYEFHLKLRDQAAAMPYVGSLIVINAQGRVTDFSRQWPIPDIDVSDRDYFKPLQSDPNLTSFVGAPVRDRATRTMVIPLLRKISGANKEFVGLVSATIELQSLQNSFSEITLESGSAITLLRQDGVLIARFPRKDSDIGRRFPDAIGLKLLSTAEHGVGVSEGLIGGHSRMIAAHRVGGTYPIVVTASRTMDGILDDWRQTAAYVIGISALSFVAVAAFAFLFIRLFKNYQALVKARAKQEEAEQLRQQSLRFDVALNNMSQGLLMFDASARMVVCNEHYIRMYGLSAEVVKPGLTFVELIEHRAETGSFSGNSHVYCSQILDEIANGQLTSHLVETADGRTVHVSNQPMAAGGWVATHEDITDKVNADNAIKIKKHHLDTALANISQGLCMFDAEQRLIVCNKRYADLYGLNDEQTKPGTTLHAILEHRIASGNAPADQDNYIKDRLNEVTINKAYQITNRLRDGRYVSVVHRPMPDGGWVATHEDVSEAVRREESFRLLFERNPVPMWISDRESLRFLAVNDAAVTLYGYSREQFLAMVAPDLRPVEDCERFSHFLRTLPDDQLAESIGQHSKVDGTTIDISVFSRALIYMGHEARLAAIHDITKAKLAEDELRRTKNFLNTIIESVPLPILVKEAPSPATGARDCRLTLINRAFEELMGVTREQIIGKTAHELYPEDPADYIIERDLEALQSDEAVSVYEHSLVTPSNGTRIVTAKKVAIRDKGEKAQYLLTVLDDVTARRRAEERILYLAHNDILTDLPNRAAFIECFTATLNTSSKTDGQFAILSIDLDRFKEANDVYGHAVGDALLGEMARRLKAAAGGAFLARVGGDEFMLITTDGPQPAAAEALSEHLIATVKEDFEVDGHRLKFGLSIGGAVHPTDGTDAKTLMISADAALYRAKAEFRGSVQFFEAEMGVRLHERRDLQNDLRSAVGRGELFLHYQPQRTMAGETIGFEALVRWRCPKRGVVSPGTFIPIAEESNLILPVGEWVLREACREAASWPQPLTISVNISPIQFRHGNLPSLVHSMLLETGLASTRLELEITEGVMIDDFSRAVAILRKLKSLGVQIAMDDFGSGYSSMSYLHAFPFDKIKIDRTFIGDLEHNRHSIAIVRAIIGLGHNLGVPLLAEGVETEAQHVFLVREGCDEVQGYLTGRPLPIEHYAELVGREANANHAVTR